MFHLAKYNRWIRKVMQLIRASLAVYAAALTHCRYCHNKVQQNELAQGHDRGGKKGGHYERAAECVCLPVDPVFHREQCANTD